MKFYSSLFYQVKQNILNSCFEIMNPQQPPSAITLQPVSSQPSTEPSKSNLRNRNNFIFGIVIVLYQILTLPIYGVLFNLSDALTLYKDYGGILLVSISTILVIIGLGLINGYVARSSFTGITYTLLIFALTTQHFFLFRAFWNKAGTNDYENSTKSFGSWFNIVTLSNYGVDRQATTLLPSGSFVEAIACAMSMAVAFNPVVGRIGCLQIFVLTFLGAFLYEVNAQLIYRWFITDNGFGCRIFLFGSIVGLISSFLLGRKQTTVNHYSYQSNYKFMSFSLLGFLFLVVSLPSLSSISLFTRSTYDNAVLYAGHINAWLAIMSSLLGTFTASAFIYRKFSVHDLVFNGSAGAIALAMEADICFNPCVPLIVGFVIGFICSLFPAGINRKVNSAGVTSTFNHIQRFIIPAILSTIVSAIVQASGVSANGAHIQNLLDGRTHIQQGGWQIIGLLITTGTAALAGLLIGLAYKAINNHETYHQFNDTITYDNVPDVVYQSD